MTTPRRVQVTLVVTVALHLDPWEWGDDVAAWLEHEMRDTTPDLGATVQCVDVEDVKDDATT